MNQSLVFLGLTIVVVILMNSKSKILTPSVKGKTYLCLLLVAVSFLLVNQCSVVEGLNGQGSSNPLLAAAAQQAVATDVSNTSDSAGGMACRCVNADNIITGTPLNDAKACNLLQQQGLPGLDMTAADNACSSCSQGYKETRVEANEYGQDFPYVQCGSNIQGAGNDNCATGYHFENNQCMANQCICDNGTPAIGTECPNDGDPKCVDPCNDGYTLNGGACEEQIQGYQCTNGTKFSTFVAAREVITGIEPADEKDIGNYTEACESCNTGYTLNNTSDTEARCDENECTCENGTPARGPACPTAGEPRCAMCTPGYYLTNNYSCQENTCFCPGAAKDSESPTGVDCLSNGNLSCYSDQCANILSGSSGLSYGLLEVETNVNSNRQTGICEPTGIQCECLHGVPEPTICPLDQPYNCKSCDQGYESVTNSGGQNICEPLNCQAGEHIGRNGKKNSCVTNTCKCTNGTAATGKACFSDGSTNCAVCSPGYHLEGLRCVANICTCPNGSPNTGTACLNHNSISCASCATPDYTMLEGEGYCIHESCTRGKHYVSSIEDCVQNTCTCSHGKAATGEACIADGAEICDPNAACNTGYHLEGLSCVENTCTCPYSTTGLGEIGPKCPSNMSNYCSTTNQCVEGYYLNNNNNSCDENECTCNNGVGATGISCPTNGTEQCINCNTGYYLQDGACLPNQCTCLLGTGATGTACPFNGQHKCIEPCNDGYGLSEGYCIPDMVLNASRLIPSIVQTTLNSDSGNGKGSGNKATSK